MIYCSFGNAYRLTGNETYKDVIHTAVITSYSIHYTKLYDYEIGYIENDIFTTKQESTPTWRRNNFV